MKPLEDQGTTRSMASVKMGKGMRDVEVRDMLAFYGRCKRIPPYVAACTTSFEWGQRSVREIARSMVYGRAAVAVS